MNIKKVILLLTILFLLMSCYFEINNGHIEPINSPAITGAYYSSSSQKITISSRTSLAEIYYTTDGTTPNSSDYKYTGPFTVANGKTVKARARKDGYWSDVATYSVSIPTISEPTITGTYYSDSSQQITINCSTSGATIYYTTDGTEPNSNDYKYTGSFTVANGKTIKARARKDGYWSDVATYTAVSKPTITVSSYSSNYQLITISCSTSGATIYYTTDGTTPDSSDNKYTGSITVTNDKTVKARALKDGTWSDIVTHTVTAVSKPTITESYYSGSSQQITINCSTSGAIIYYTTDGTVPYSSDYKYTGPFTVANGKTVNARALKDGVWSDVVTHVVTTVSKPTIERQQGTGINYNIQIHCTTSGATVYYTTDGTEPDIDDSVYSGPFTASEGTMIKAKAYKNGYWSESASYVVPTIVATPSITSSYYSSSYAEISINCETEGATIYYTTDGTGPNTYDYKYTNLFTVAGGRTVKARAYKDGYWSETSSYYVTTSISAPSITRAYYSPTSKKISLTCSTEGATIYYTTDGSTPDVFDNKYSDSIVVSDGTTLKVRAYRGGYWSSTVTEVISTVVDVPTLKSSYFSSELMKLTFSCSTLGATIYYTTDGTTPDINDNKYSSSFTASDGTTLTIRAYNDGYWSDTVVYKVITSIEEPMITKIKDAPSYAQVSISCLMDGVTIYYTTDGTTPDSSDNKYTGSFNVSIGTTVKARAYKDGYWSESASYVVPTIVATPSITSSYYSSSYAEISINCETEGATIYYTTDGTIPDVNDDAYTSPFVISEDIMVKARAYKDVYWSDIVTHYGIGSIGPAGGYVFYDCDADNETGNADGLLSTECGWRYLEVAHDHLGTYIFGPENISVSTASSIGSGKKNTEALVSRFGAGSYAAKICDDYSLMFDGIVFDDWFLPSILELEEMYWNLKDVIFFSSIGEWSSSANTESVNTARVHVRGGKYVTARDAEYRVRAVRAFI